MKIVAKRKWRYPYSIEREYTRTLTRYVNKIYTVSQDMLDEMVEAILKIRNNAGTLDDIDVIIDRAIAKVGSIDRNVVEKYFDNANQFNLSEWNAITKSVFGIELGDVMEIQRSDDMDLETLKQIWVSDNVDLINGMTDEEMAKIRRQLILEISGTDDAATMTGDLADVIEEVTGYEENRAVLIAVDQMGKLNGQITRYRQTHAGIEQFMWSTSKDGRVRPSHREREGKVYDWDDPPDGEYPGEPIRCRCIAYPVFDLDKIVIRGSNFKIGAYKKL